MSRPLFRSRQRGSNYQKSINGIIIYVHPTDGWCNVKDSKENTYYRIYFGEGVSPRLKRIKQPVVMTQVIGNRYKYIITGAAYRSIGVTDFQPKGTAKWDDGGDVEYDNFYQWK